MANPAPIFDCAWLGLGLPAAATLQRAVLERVTVQAEAAAAQHALAGGGMEAMAATQALRGLPEARRSAIMLHPAFRYWVQAMRRTSRGDPDGLARRYVQEAAGFVWAPLALEGGLSRPWHVPTDARGGLRCAGLGRFVELGPDYADQIVTVLPGDGGAVIRAEDGLVVEIPFGDLEGPRPADAPSIALHGYALNVSPCLVEGRIEATTRDPWLRVHLTGTNQRQDGTRFHGPDDDAYADAPDLAPLQEGLALLGDVWPEALADMAAFTRVIVPLGDGRYRPPGPGKDGCHTAFTVSSRQGALYVAGAPPAAMVEMLLHENAHVKLRQIQAIDPLLEDPLDETVRVPVSWRPDPRPLPGILEGFFVFLHVAEFELRHAALAGRPDALASGLRRLADLEKAHALLVSHARLTKAGDIVLRTLRAWLDRLSARVPVHAPAE